MELINNYDVEMMDEINGLLEELNYYNSDVLIQDLRDIIIETYNKGALDLDGCLMNLGDFESAKESEKALIRAVEWEQGFSKGDLIEILTDFKWFISQLSDNYIFYYKYTLLALSEEFLRQDIENGDISERLADFIDMDLYCQNLEGNGYVEVEDGVLYY